MMQHRIHAALLIGVLAGAAHGARMGFISDSGIGNSHPGGTWTDFYGNVIAPNYTVSSVKCLNYKNEPCTSPSYAKEVFRTLRNAGVEVVVHLGDLDYESAPEMWDLFLDQELGDMKYLTAKGNHDSDGTDGVEDLWSGPNGYGAILSKRADGPKKGTNLECTGSYGESMSCNFDDTVQFYIGDFGVDAKGEGANRKGASNMRKELAATPDSSKMWKLCLWHMNMQAMQVSYKGDATGWEVYDICRQQGAFIMTGHAHTYSRSVGIGQFATEKWNHHTENITISSTDKDIIELSSGPKGTTGVAVMGIGGHRNEPQLLTANHWAKIWSSECISSTCEQAMFPDTFGAMICDFPEADEGDVAMCALVSNRGNIYDKFALSRDSGASNVNVGRMLNQYAAELKADIKQANGADGVDADDDGGNGPAKYNWGTIDAWWMGPPSTGGCYDNVPSGDNTCWQQKEWGQCDADWMKNGKYCDKTCGRCSPRKIPVQPSYVQSMNQAKTMAVTTLEVTDDDKFGSTLDR